MRMVQECLPANSGGTCRETVIGGSITIMFLAHPAAKAAVAPMWWAGYSQGGRAHFMACRSTKASRRVRLDAPNLRYAVADAGEG
jgi:hypothetical protein